MKRILYVLAALILVSFALTACQGSTSDDDDGPEESTAANHETGGSIRKIAYSDKNNKKREQDWTALKEVNDEIAGWIRLDDSGIDYPVMYHKGDDQNSQYYLKHSYEHDLSENGEIFIDYRCPQGADSKNVILHGHNMNDGSMFHSLLNYSDRFDGDLFYYRGHAVITFNTPKEDAKWKVISVFKTSTLSDHGEFFNYMQGAFLSDAEFMNFVYNVRIRSMFNAPVTVNENDQLLTLSTCSYEYSDFRTVVVARKVREGEDPTVDVKSASVNDDPFLPEICYTEKGKKRPDPGTFKSAYKDGKVSWYDGRYDGKSDDTLKGSETLSGSIADDPSADGSTEKNGSRKVFQVVYLNMDGSQFAAYNVPEGEPIPVPDKKPTYEDEYFTYTFTGWDTDIEGVDFEHLNTGVVIAPKFTYKMK